MNREEIFQAAYEQAKRARMRFRNCKNKYAFREERAICARWDALLKRLWEKEPHRRQRRSKAPTSLAAMLALSGISVGGPHPF